MLLTSIALLLPLSSLVAVSATPELVGRALALEKRQSSTAGLLSSIFDAATPGCNTTCSQATDAFVACAALSSQASIAACACSSQTIGDVRACSACISTDSRTSSRDSTGVIGAYNSYVDLCTTEGLASVTGTLAATASTSALSSRTRLSMPPSGASIATRVSASANATYNPNQSVTSVARVPSLAASVATTMGNGTQASGVAGASATPRSAAGRVIVGGVMAVVGGAVALLV